MNGKITIDKLPETELACPTDMIAVCRDGQMARRATLAAVMKYVIDGGKITERTYAGPTPLGNSQEFGPDDGGILTIPEDGFALFSFVQRDHFLSNIFEYNIEISLDGGNTWSVLMCEPAVYQDLTYKLCKVQFQAAVRHGAKFRMADRLVNNAVINPNVECFVKLYID